MARIGDRKQALSGLLFLLLGVGTLVALPQRIGTAVAMGAGYFPLLLGSCLILFGGTSILLGLRSTATPRRDEIEHLPVRTLLCVLGGIVLFGVLIDMAGLAVSLACLIGMSCADRLLRHPVEMLVIYAVLLALTWFLFIHIIQIPITILWAR